MKDNKRKKLVDALATSMCEQENRLSTKRLKIEMRNQYPNETWNKYHDGKNQGVSDYFHELVQEGKYVSITDNGTYQTYACTSLPILCRRGDTYIADQVEPASQPQTSIGKTMKKLMKALTKGTPSFPFTPAVSPVQTATTASKRGSKPGVKRGSYNTKAKRAAQATQTTSTKATASTVKQPRLANGKFASKNLTTAAAAAKANPTKANVTAAFGAMGNKTHNVRTVSRTKALKMIQDYKGKLTIATFINKDGEERTMRFQLIDPNPTPLGYLRVNDVKIVAANDLKDAGIRNINLQTLKHIKLGRKSCNVS